MLSVLYHMSLWLRGFLGVAQALNSSMRQQIQTGSKSALPSALHTVWSQNPWFFFYYVVLQNGQMQGFLQEGENKFCPDWLNACGLVRAKVTAAWQCGFPGSRRMCTSSQGAVWRILEPCRSNWQKSNWTLSLKHMLWLEKGMAARDCPIIFSSGIFWFLHKV